jgi:actin-like ATPase involved in cell morphogenesis
MIVGIDFGTSNSLVTYIEKTDGGHAVALLDGKDPHPSVLWYEGNKVVCGRQAKEQLSQSDGSQAENIVKSPKLLLGKRIPVPIAGVEHTPSQVSAELLKFLRDHATTKLASHKPFTEAVITIPVTMQGPGRRALREAAHLAGIGVVQFVHEPLAALYGYYRKSPLREAELQRMENRVALVFDWGGGTLDMTLVRVREGNLCQIQNLGLDTVGGDEFDRALMHFCMNRFMQEHGIHEDCFQLGQDKILLDQCEQAKIMLSSREQTVIFVPNFARVDGKSRNLECTLTRADLDEATAPLVDLATRALRTLLQRADLAPAGIELCLATGGMVLMPTIHARLLELFDGRRVPKPSAIGSATLISEGAAWIAHDGSRLTLSKPVELEMASGQYLALIEEGLELPFRENHWCDEAKTFYCTDPTDGKAKFILTRPRWPGHTHRMDARDVYKEVLLDVDARVGGMFQRLQVKLAIDSNLVLTATCTALGLNYEPYATTTAEVHDLEFGLQLPQRHEVAAGGGGYRPAAIREDRERRRGGIALRSNVSDTHGRWHEVPGDVVERFNPIYFDPRNAPGSLDGQTALRRQLRERDYYLPFSGSNRLPGLIQPLS